MTFIKADTELYRGIYRNLGSNRNYTKDDKQLATRPPLINILKVKINEAKDISQLTPVFQQASGVDKGLIQINPPSFALQGYKFLIAQTNLAINLATNLKIANANELQSAPIFIETVDSKDPNLKVLISYEPGLEGDINKCDTYAFALLNGKLDGLAQRIFMKEVEALFDAGYINPAIIEQRTSLKVNPKSGLIFACNWENLEGPFRV
jgi:hypothetical protein